jgi:hypothetical protein
MKSNLTFLCAFICLLFLPTATLALSQTKTKNEKVENLEQVDNKSLLAQNQQSDHSSWLIKKEESPWLQEDSSPWLIEKDQSLWLIEKDQSPWLQEEPSPWLIEYTERKKREREVEGIRVQPRETKGVNSI